MEAEEIETNCRFDTKLDLLHKWLHLVSEDFGPKEIDATHALAHAILDLLNEGAGADQIDGVKVLALFSAICMGLDAMEKQLVLRRQWAFDGTKPTVH
jgi:hypothetical protein